MTDSRLIKPARLKKLLRSLLDIYSPSGKEEEILDFLHGYLKRRGLPVTRQEVDEESFNLVVAPPDVELELGLVGHLDTVEAYDLDHYGFEEDGDEVIGLGAADMKSGVAAMIEAYVSASERGPLPPVALCLVVGEEQDGRGATELCKDYQFPWAVIGEPTDLLPCLSNYGYLEVQVTIRGQRMHASLADQVQSPIERMLSFIHRFIAYVKSSRPEAVYNIRELYSSQAGFFVPELCESRIDIHLPPTAPVAAIMHELEELVAKDDAHYSELDAGVRFATVDAGFELPEKGPLIDALRTIFERRSLAWAPEPFRSHSDAARLWEAGIRPVILGPGQLAKAHAPDESISFPQVLQAAEIYAELIGSMSR